MNDTGLLFIVIYVRESIFLISTVRCCVAVPTVCLPYAWSVMSAFVNILTHWLVRTRFSLEWYTVVSIYQLLWVHGFWPSWLYGLACLRSSVLLVVPFVLAGAGLYCPIMWSMLCWGVTLHYTYLCSLLFSCLLVLHSCGDPVTRIFIVSFCWSTNAVSWFWPPDTAVFLKSLWSILPNLLGWCCIR
jgi:hypothetical protein